MQSTESSRRASGKNIKGEGRRKNLIESYRQQTLSLDCFEFFGHGGLDRINWEEFWN